MKYSERKYRDQAVAAIPPVIKKPTTWDLLKNTVKSPLDFIKKKIGGHRGFEPRP
jgi:hypothetical protein